MRMDRKLAPPPPPETGTEEFRQRVGVVEQGVGGTRARRRFVYRYHRRILGSFRQWCRPCVRSPPPLPESTPVTRPFSPGSKPKFSEAGFRVEDSSAAEGCAVERLTVRTTTRNSNLGCRYRHISRVCRVLVRSSQNVVDFAVEGSFAPPFLYWALHLSCVLRR